MRQVPCKFCNSPNRNTGKNKNGSWYGVCYGCGFKLSENSWTKRRDARIGWNKFHDPDNIYAEDNGGEWK